MRCKVVINIERGAASISLAGDYGPSMNVIHVIGGDQIILNLDPVLGQGPVDLKPKPQIEATVKHSLKK